VTESFLVSALACQAIRERRTLANERRGSVDLRVDGAEREDPDRVGVPAELAARQWDEVHGFGYEFPPLDTGPDQGWDFRNPLNGATGDIKATTYRSGHLLVPAYQLPVKADRLILAVVDVARCFVIFVGWVSAKTFTRHAASPCSDCGRSPYSGIWLHASRLRGMEVW
jgi:hypothetical protein